MAVAAAATVPAVWSRGGPSRPARLLRAAVAGGRLGYHGAGNMNVLLLWLRFHYLSNVGLLFCYQFAERFSDWFSYHRCHCWCKLTRNSEVNVDC